MKNYNSSNLKDNYIINVDKNDQFLKYKSCYIIVSSFWFVWTQQLYFALHNSYTKEFKYKYTLLTLIMPLFYDLMGHKYV